MVEQWGKGSLNGPRRLRSHPRKGVFGCEVCVDVCLCMSMWVSGRVCVVQDVSGRVCLYLCVSECMLLYLCGCLCVWAWACVYGMWQDGCSRSESSCDQSMGVAEGWRWRAG